MQKINSNFKITQPQIMMDGLIPNEKITPLVDLSEPERAKNGWTDV